MTRMSTKGLTMADKSIVNISGYRFVTLKAEQLPLMKEQLLVKAKQCSLKGTILLSSEGINAFLSGTDEQMNTFLCFLHQYEPFESMTFKKSYSNHQPFTRMLVRIKKEIISMGVETVQPEKHTSPYLSPEDFKQWYDSNKEMVVLDTRNDFEVALGTFDQAVDMNLKSFRSFPEKVSELPQEMKKKPVVTFCTGGIRCEKAAELLLQEGFEEVYQLDGGILNYFEQCGGDHFHGDCFVFDKRVAVDSALQETATQQCYACRAPVLINEQKADGTCPHCQGNVLTGKRY